MYYYVILKEIKNNGVAVTLNFYRIIYNFNAKLKQIFSQCGMGNFSIRMLKQHLSIAVSDSLLSSISIGISSYISPNGFQ